MVSDSNLSPQAQAVLDAANRNSSYSPDDCLNESRWIVAAALRAAAVYCKRDRLQLIAIAEELESTHGD